MTFRKKYFFFDIDGTLTVGNPGVYVPESCKRTLQQLKDKGHFLAIATGRSYAMAKAYLEEFDFDNMVCDGGNCIILNRQFVDSLPLNREHCIALLEELDQKNIPWGVSLDISSVRYCKDSSFYDFTHDTYMTTTIKEDLDYHTIENFYKIYVACFKDDESKIETLNKLPFGRYHKEYLFVEPDDKSVGIKMIMDHFHAPYEDVVVFGDAKNDLKMFIPEWTSIAMGNGIDLLKEKATFVTKNGEDDGIEYACKHFGWID